MCVCGWLVGWLVGWFGHRVLRTGGVLVWVFVRMVFVFVYFGQRWSGEIIGIYSILRSVDPP